MSSDPFLIDLWFPISKFESDVMRLVLVGKYAVMLEIRVHGRLNMMLD